MKLLHSRYEILPQSPGIDGAYRQIEKAGRTCYKSENKIGDGTDVKFFNMLVDRGHTAMLEHGTVYLYDRVSPVSVSGLDKYRNDKYSDYVSVMSDDALEVFVTTNMRVIVENHWAMDLTQYLCDEPMSEHKRRYTVKFICDRATANEMVRHRTFSFAQESTRYCNYSKDKFGSELCFIYPAGYDAWKDNCKLTFVDSCRCAEQYYLNLTGCGLQAQDARAVLPLSLKTEIVLTGNTDAWKHFFGLRCSGNAHPDIKYLADRLKEEFEERKFI